MNPAMPVTLTNPATCPEWCTDRHQPHERIPNAHGFWNLLHTDEPVYVTTGEVLPSGVSADVSVNTEEYVSETPANWVPRTVFIKAVDEFGSSDGFAITARQALRLAEVLVQQAAVVLAEENVALKATR